jgi:hypothetical protein
MMCMGWPADLTWYKLLTDWGSLIGGFFALVAGALAYFSGKLQANATRQAAKAAERENLRRFAREGLVASRLMNGVLIRIADDINKLNKLLSNQVYSGTNAVAVPSSWSKSISKPSQGILWNSLGTCEIERNGRGRVQRPPSSCAIVLFSDRADLAALLVPHRTALVRHRRAVKLASKSV